MKIEVGDKAFEFSVNGKPLEADDAFEAFVALGSGFFSFAVITRGEDENAPVRAVTFAADREYADAVLDQLEPLLGEDEEIGLMGLETGSDEDENDEGVDA